MKVTGWYNLCMFTVRSPDDIEDEEASFAPEMCHQVFGENENIFGYTDLRIRLYYSAGSLQTYLGIQYTEKVKYFCSYLMDNRLGSLLVILSLSLSNGVSTIENLLLSLVFHYL